MSRENSFGSLSTIGLMLIVSYFGVVPTVSDLNSRPDKEDVRSDLPTTDGLHFPWDDPLPVAEVLKTNKIIDRLPPTTVPILVGVRAGVRPEEIETRIRTRYAVTRSLLALGFMYASGSGDLCVELSAPEDNTYGTLGAVIENRSASAGDPAAGGTTPAAAHARMPVEVFRKAGAPSDSEDHGATQVAIIWVEESWLLQGSSTNRLLEAGRVAQALVAGAPLARVIYLGPTSSDVLSSLIEDRNTTPLQRDELQRLVQICITSSTADEVQKKAVAQFGAVRLIGGDDALLLMMIHELVTRGLCDAPQQILEPTKVGALQVGQQGDAKLTPTGYPGRDGNRPASILVIAEADSEYGRHWVERLLHPKDALGCSCTHDATAESHPAWRLFAPAQQQALCQTLTGWNASPPIKSVGGTQIRVIRYLRGVDGRKMLPTDAARNGGERKSAQVSASRTQQLDYVQQEIRSLGRRAGEEGDSLADAVILLGGDIYDKLTLLRLVRSEMPRSLVLTTDLDARYLDPSERPFTRNLVIVSHESLEPSEFSEVRFRDEYQRAIAVGLRTALSGRPLEAAMRMASSPDPNRVVRTTEVGRSAFIECEQRQGKLSEIGSVSESTTRYARSGLGIFMARNWWICLTSAGLLSALIFFLFEGDRSKGITSAHLAVLCIVVGALLFLAIIATVYTGNATLELIEPLVVAQGVSVWPTAAILMIASILAVAALIWICLRSAASRVEARLRYLSEENLHASIQEVWRQFSESSRVFSMKGMLRVGLTFAFFCAFVALIVHEFPDIKGSVRGAFAAGALKGCMAAVTIGVALLLGVLTLEVLAFIQLAQHLRALCSVRSATHQSGTVPVSDLRAAFRALMFHSSCTALHVYAPLVILAIHLFSQYPIFDKFGGSIQSLLIYVLVSAWLVLTTLRLNHHAALLRLAVRDRARQELESANCGEADSKSWSELISEVESAREGVFAPIHETPLFRAVLIPSSSLGVPTLLSMLGVQL